MNAPSEARPAAALAGDAAGKRRRTALAKSSLVEILASADIRIGGGRPWDIRVHHERFYERVLAEGTLGFGESYMDEWWDCDALDAMCHRVIRAGIEERMPLNFRMLLTMMAAAIFNFQDKRGARRGGRQHYDLGNDFFEAMLDPAMQYSCAYFRGTEDLAVAQKLKLELICRKLGAKKIIMLTGDQSAVARSIAEEAGIDEFRAEQLPADKVQAIRQLKEEGSVIMIGDGVNDAPALATAHLGVAMGAAGTDIAMETADIVLMGDRLENIPLLIGMARHAKNVLTQNLIFASGVILVLVAGALGFALALPLGVIGHEGSTVIVCLNGLRLLAYRPPKHWMAS